MRFFFNHQFWAAGLKESILGNRDVGDTDTV